MKRNSRKALWVCTDKQRAWRTTTLDCVQPSRAAGLRVTGDRDQVWVGFGGCFNELGWQALGRIRPVERARVLAELFHPRKGCRFNFCRVPIGASDYGIEWYSHNETRGDLAMKRFSIERDRRGLLPYIKAALAHQPDLKLFASPWSPPTWMKHPPVYNYGRLVWKPEIRKAYALYLAKFVEAYRKEGVNVCQLHPQNEPTADQKFPSCLWSGTHMRDFIRDDLGPMFRERGLDCEIWLGTINSSDFDEYALTVLSDPGARRHVSGVAYQWDGRQAIQRTRQAWPDLPLMQSENECGDGKNTWGYAQYIFRLFQHYISNGVSVYCYWNMVLEPGGASTWGWPQNSMVTADPSTGRAVFNPEFYVMKHFSHFIEPGARRLISEGPWSANAVAFENPDGRVVAVLNNPLNETQRIVCHLGREAVRLTLQPMSFHTVVCNP